MVNFSLPFLLGINFEEENMEILGYMLAIATGLIWGLIGISVLELNKLGLNPYEISFVRTFLAFLFGYIFLKLKREKKKETKIKKSVFLLILLSGIMCQAGLNIFFTKSIAKIGTITSIVLMATGPIFTIILSKILFKEKMGVKKVISLVLAISGVLILVTGGDLGQLNFELQGVILGLLAGFCYGFFPIVNKKVASDIDTTKALIYSFGAASIFLMFFLEKTSFIKFFQVNILLLSSFYAVVPTLLAYLLYVNSMLYIPASLASLITLLEVPMTAVIGVLFLNENINIISFFGIVLIIFGIVFLKINILKK